MFDKNKIIVNEKLIRLPKVKLKTNKKRTKKTKTPRPILTNRAHVPSNALSEWQLDRNVADLNANSVGVQATSLNASRADSLVTSLKTMDLIGNAINETDSNFVNVFNTNDVNNSNLDASISSSIRQKSKSNSKNPSDNLVNLEYLFSDSVSKNRLNKIWKINRQVRLSRIVQIKLNQTNTSRYIVKRKRKTSLSLKAN